MAFLDFLRGSTAKALPSPEIESRITKLENQNQELVTHINILQKRLDQTNATLQVVTAANQQMALDMNTIYHSLQAAMEAIGIQEDTAYDGLSLPFGFPKDDDDLPN